jgi:flagellar basal-body rod protein FlgB
MPISDIPIFSMLRTKMQWHQERQRVLAENVANADTPEFRPRDLKPLDFGRDGRGPGQMRGQIALASTDPAHIAASGAARSRPSGRTSTTSGRPATR